MAVLDRHIRNKALIRHFQYSTPKCAAADIAAARNLQNELNALLQSPVESPEREAAKNAVFTPPPKTAKSSAPPPAIFHPSRAFFRTFSGRARGDTRYTLTPFFYKKGVQKIRFSSSCTKLNYTTAAAGIQTPPHV